ncbi:hypothetical protein V9T40_001920 [Parthenolecanium corni]|uniref:Uncharacterized protein n=1 Tax=Parthenolecanium corni TaxID=536013 RepID=A0AAN9TTK5_9HEMI
MGVFEVAEPESEVVGWIPAVSILTQLSQFSAECLNFGLDVSFFVLLLHFPSSCFKFRPAVYTRVQVKDLTANM